MMGRKQRILDAYKKGTKVKDIAKMENITIPGIYQILKKENISKTRSRGNSKEELGKKAVKEYMLGRTYKSVICRKYGISYFCLNHWMQIYGKK